MKQPNSDKEGNPYKRLVIILFSLVMVVAVFMGGNHFVKKNQEEKAKEQETVKNSLEGDIVAEIFNDKKPDTIHASTYELIRKGGYQDTVSQTEFKQIYKTDKPTVFYYYSSECIHCQNFTPVLNQVAEKEGITLVKHNLLEYPEDYETYQIEGTPTLTYHIKGKEVQRVVGDIGEEGATQFFAEFKKELAKAEKKATKEK